jgi:hypothetical protein
MLKGLQYLKINEAISHAEIFSQLISHPCVIVIYWCLTFLSVAEAEAVFTVA